MTDLPFHSAKRLASALRRGKLRSVDLLDLYIERMERLNPRINAIVTTDLKSARKRAEAADAALKRGVVLGPLHGLPMTVKESYDVAGLASTWGSPAFKGNVAKTNSIAVQRLTDAGAIVFGKTNVPLMLGDWQSYNAVYGSSNNPWDLTRTPGGSSGGSAAALAAGLTGLEAGSDIGGSIRVPAHFCGVYGHKPTWPIITPRGHALGGRVAVTDVSVVGPLGRSADDLALSMEILGGPDAIDGAGWRLELPKPKKKALRQFKVAVLYDDPNSEVDRQIIEQLQALVEFLGKQRVKIDERARPAVDFSASHRLYLNLLYGALSGRQTAEDYARNVEEAQSLAPGDESHRARVIRGSVLSHRDWLGLNEARHQMRLKWAQFFEDFDLLLCPPAAVPAFPHDHVSDQNTRTFEINGEAVPSENQLFWAGISGAVYLPGTAAPIGRTAAGLPVGVQIVGPQYGDLTCIAFAGMLEREYYGFVPPPGFE